MTYHVGQEIFIHKLKTKGEIQEVMDDGNVYVEYEKRKGKHTYLATDMFNVDEISLYRPKSKRQYNRKPLDIKIKYFDKSLPKIEKIEVGDWIDLRATESVHLYKGEFELIPLGVAMQLPKGYEAHVVPRSSTYKRWKVLQTNSFGVIDESYCGDNDQWQFPALAMEQTKINKGDRICQFRIVRKMPNVNFVEVDELGNEDRKGFGSTGTK